MVQRRVGRRDTLDQRRRGNRSELALIPSDAIHNPTSTTRRSVAVVIIVVRRWTERRSAVVGPCGMCRTYRSGPQGKWWSKI